MPMPARAGAERALRIAGLVLAGGEGRRMGGVDKGWQPLAGRALVEHVVARLAPQVDTLLISANRTLEAYRALGLPVVCDETAWRGMGPLAGVASAMAQLPPSIDALQLSPCDTPLLPPDLVTRLAAALAADPACGAVYPQTPDGPEPGFLLVRASLLDSLPAYLRSGGRSLRGWLACLHGCAVPFDAAPAFANANDPESLARLAACADTSPLPDSGSLP